MHAGKSSTILILVTSIGLYINESVHYNIKFLISVQSATLCLSILHTGTTIPLGVFVHRVYTTIVFWWDPSKSGLLKCGHPCIQATSKSPEACFLIQINP